MAEKKNTFQIGLLVVFGLAILIAVILFSVSKSNSSSGIASVVVWGTFPESTFRNSLEVMNNKDKETGVKISYEQKNPTTYNSELVEAFASGTGPDLFFVNQEMLFSFENKIQELSFENLPERDFNLRYVDGARVFLSNTGVRAFPFAVDPLVMYYNKSILNTVGVVNPPVFWNQFASLVPQLTTLDSNQNILKSGLAFGQFGNIPYATNILEAFLLQLGTPIITKDISVNYVSVIDTSTIRETRPLSTSLQFFTLFADPLKDTYSWNSVLPNAEDMFVQDRLALYFAPASKFLDIQRKNINLNYDITKLPQISETANFVTSADFYGIAIAKSSKVLPGAFTAANLI